MKIFSFFTDNYIELADEWYSNCIRVGIKPSQIKLYTNDKQISDTTTTTSSKYNYISGNINNKKDIWPLRTKIFLELLEQYPDELIIHCDLDAWFTKNPEEYLNEICQNTCCDIIVSQGTSWPPWHLQRHGFTMCCGFYGFNKLSQQNVSFLNKYISEIKDDQRTLNDMLIDTQWNENSKKFRIIKFHEHPLKCFNDVLNGTNTSHNLTVSLLPFVKFQRNLFENLVDIHQSYLLHPCQTLELEQFLEEIKKYIYKQ